MEDDGGHREQCDYRFPVQELPALRRGERHRRARRCHQCREVLVDPDDMLKAALKLKDALVRCGGMELQSGRDDKGEWLKATYYDEDGTSTSERFRLQTPAQRKAFEMLFLRLHQRAPGVPFARHTAADVLAQQQALRHPDFVVARKRGQFWQVREKSVRLSRPFPPRQSVGLSERPQSGQVFVALRAAFR